MAKRVTAKKKAAKAEVSVRFMKPNKLFSDNLTALIRGYVYEKPVLCPACGKKKRGHWTMLCPFRAVPWPTEQTFYITSEDKPLRAAGVSVCSDCMLAPALPRELIEGYPLQISMIPAA